MPRFIEVAMIWRTLIQRSPDHQEEARRRQPAGLASGCGFASATGVRYRSRNASTDSDFLGMMPTSPSVVGDLTIDLVHEAAYEGDDEDKGVDRVESPHNLVMPREYAAQEAAWPVVSLSNAKAMERRRASGF
ncbi:unnamed protein product [Phytophthora fragariaefolia]|uniref:Unnamed protein product n=1 Tax=Phytophthora fragariaefolia TaxID=1490495 RepID=A0A9W6YCR1_9STRA|nr:unnamed protein product [Phytophthora fragariaefolia]